MLKKWYRWAVMHADDIYTAVLVFGALGAMLGLIFVCYVQVIEKNKCLAAGYSGIEGGITGRYCVGIRDGNTVTVKVEDLG